MLPSVPGPSEASSSEAAYPGERGRVDGGGVGWPPRSCRAHGSIIPVGREEKLASSHGTSYSSQPDMPAYEALVLL